MQGSRVTTRVSPVSHQLQRALAACRIATISACAVGPWSISPRFRARVMTVPSSRMTASAGTSSGLASPDPASGQREPHRGLERSGVPGHGPNAISNAPSTTAPNLSRSAIWATASSG